MRDMLVAFALPIAFALLVTVHVALAYGLAARDRPWRAALALIAPPLAPWWGARAGLRRRSVAWVICAIAYVALRLMAR